MTFYWWSHWFWITSLSIILVLPIVFVHTYPSHDIAPEYNNNNNDNKNLKSVTKLYQTTTTLIWATTFPPIHKEVAATVAAQARTKLLNIPATVEQTAAAVKDLKDEVVENVDRSDSGVLEFKRSTDENQFNKTEVEREVTIAQQNLPPARQSSNMETRDNSTVVEPLSGQVTASDVKSLLTTTRQEKELKDFSVNSNYSNFSSITTSKIGSIESSEVQNATAEKLSTSSSSLSSSLTPSQPQIENNAHSDIEWLNSRADGDLSSSSSIGQKVPFTLENVNKEDEIVRAENEHRSRKSKVLSAEYNHINRFINFSTDSKSLLTRSASTAPNEYDADEGNISSEALAIKRTYFLDASAISAICLTVFGVCCTVGTLGIVLYRRRFLNKPQALSEPDSSVYIDDSTMRDNSDEMYSLDNDSFLNSLEAMTIQNYWTDTVKHTKL